MDTPATNHPSQRQETPQVGLLAKTVGNKALVALPLTGLLLLVMTTVAVDAQGRGRRKAEDPLPAGRVESIGDGEEREYWVSAGAVPIVDLLRFMQKKSGSVLVYPSIEPSFASEVTIGFLHDVPELSYEIAEATLLANGYSVLRESRGGTTFLHLSHVTSRMAPMTKVATSVIGAAANVPLSGVDTLATKVFRLKHLDSMVASSLLRDLAGRNSSPRILALPNSQDLIVKGELSALRYFEQILAELDTQRAQPKPQPQEPKAK